MRGKNPGVRFAEARGEEPIRETAEMEMLWMDQILYRLVGSLAHSHVSALPQYGVIFPAPFRTIIWGCVSSPLPPHPH